MILGADFVFTIGKRYKGQASDTCKTYRIIPLYHYTNFEDFYRHMPYNCQLVGAEIDNRATDIKNFVHPERCICLLGAEDHGLTKKVINKCHHIVQLPGEISLNVAVAGSIIMYDIISKTMQKNTV